MVTHLKRNQRKKKPFKNISKYFRITTAKEIKIFVQWTLFKHWTKRKLKKILQDEKNSHAHGLVRLILWKWPPYQKQSRLNAISITIPIQSFIEINLKNLKFYLEIQKTQDGQTISKTTIKTTTKLLKVSPSQTSSYTLVQ